jgi:urease accessory protein
VPTTAGMRAPGPSRSLLARTRVRVERGGVLQELSCEPPLTVRRVYGEDGECALCMVGTAAGPLPGDDLRLQLEIGADARARLVSTGASIALGRAAASDRPTVPALLRTEAAIGPGAALHATPPPLIVARGAEVDVAVSISLAACAAVAWRELVVLGRTGEPGGRVRLRWDVTCDGLPLLRQTIDLGDPVLRDWPVLLHGGRVLGTALLAGPDVAARTVVAGPRATAARLADDAVLLTVLGDDAQDAEAALLELLARF